MADVTVGPTHFRFMASLKAIGPYVREGECRDGHYLFDCLSVCVDDKISPEKRTFWGWWLQLEQFGSSYHATYNLGKYDSLGEWQKCDLPVKALHEVQRNLQQFHSKLEAVLKTNYSATIILNAKSAKL